MDHVAILRKAKISKGDDLLSDILCGRKTIESRWYVNRSAPWDKVNEGDNIYLKESGGPVTAVTKVSKVIQIDNLSDQIVDEIVTKYGDEIAPSTTKSEWQTWWKNNSNKRFCILIFLDKPQKISPFEINKEGFGISSAWMVVENIDKVKKT